MADLETAPHRIAVVGSRTYTRLDVVRQFIWEQERSTVIISGGVSGVDGTTVNYARELNMPYEIYPADWSRYGRRAEALRNKILVDKADEVVAFWDGQSRGTKITIDMAKLAGKPLRVFGPEGIEKKP